MKKVVCGFVFGLLLMATGAQARADVGYPIPPPNPKLADVGYPAPPPNPKLADPRTWLSPSAEQR